MTIQGMTTCWSSFVGSRLGDDSGRYLAVGIACGDTARHDVPLPETGRVVVIERMRLQLYVEGGQARPAILDGLSCEVVRKAHYSRLRISAVANRFVSGSASVLLILAVIFQYC